MYSVAKLVRLIKNSIIFLIFLKINIFKQILNFWLHHHFSPIIRKPQSSKKAYYYYIIYQYISQKPSYKATEQSLFALKMTTQNLLIEPYSTHKLSLREVKMALETKTFCTFHLDLVLGMGLGCPFCYKNTFGTLLYKLETP